MNKLDWYYWSRKLTRPLWWFRYRFCRKHQYHIIRTELKPTYWDCDTRIIHGAFTPFQHFMDNIYEDKGHVMWDYSKQEPEEYISQEYIDERKALWKEMETLYIWWTTRDLREHDLDNDWTPEGDEAFRKEENEMLKRLIDIRECLWD